MSSCGELFLHFAKGLAVRWVRAHNQLGILSSAEFSSTSCAIEEAVGEVWLFLQIASSEPVGTEVMMEA